MPAAMNVTSAETTRDVFHFAVTDCVSQRKNTVDAIRAIEISQNEIPTKSFWSRLPAYAVPGTIISKPTAPSAFKLPFCSTFEIFIFLLPSYFLKK